MLLEQMTEMTLVIEAGGGGDLCDRVFGFGQLACGPVESEPSQILADCRLVMFLETACEVCRMHADSVRDLDQVQRIVEPAMQQISRLR